MSDLSPVPPADVVVVGAGLMGAGVVARIRTLAPRARIVMVDAGRPIGTRAFQHLHDSTEEDVRAEYLVRVSPGVQGLYVGPDGGPAIEGNALDARPGMYELRKFGMAADDVPRAALGWNAGGMGVHWTAATPRPWGGEVFDDLSGHPFAQDLATAEELLRVHPDPFGRNEVGDRVSRVLGNRFAPVSAPGRGYQPMPMAVGPASAGHEGPLPRSGPNVLLPRMLEPAGPDFEVLTSTTVQQVVHDGNRARGVRIRRPDGSEQVLVASAVVVAADVVRTPQLLFASQIRPPALGTNLNEHAFLTSQVLVDLPRLGLDLQDVPLPRSGEWAIGSYWLPHSGPEQPFHGQIMDKVFLDEDGDRLAYSVGLSWYVPTQLRAENRIEFDETEVDAAGLPRPRVTFSLSARDQELVEQARQSVAGAASELGPFDLATDSALLPAGSSLHYTGTTRSGTADDGDSVCDTEGRVWGFANLFLAGGSVVPTAVVGNSTLTGMVTAVRAARAVSRLVG